MRGLTGVASLLIVLLALFSTTTDVVGQINLTNYTITLEQGDFSTNIVPLQGTQDIVEFYNYESFQSNTGLEVIDRSMIFAYQAPSSGLSLVVLHGRANGGAGTVNFNITGLPTGYSVQIQDDADDQYTIDAQFGTFQANQNWQIGFSDGFALGFGQDPENFTLNISPDFISGITEWATLTGNIDFPETVLIPSLVEPMVLRFQRGTRQDPAQATRADFNFSPDSPGAGIPVSFNAQASRPAPGRTIVRYEWDFNGDGVFEVSTPNASVSHTFDRIGTFRVTLRVIDDTGVSATETRSVTVIEIDARALRTISTPQATPNSTFRVRLELQAGLPVNGMGVQENLPPGFEVIPVDNGGSTFKRAETQWIFPEFIEANEIRRIVYDVHVRPEAAIGPLPLSFDITGFIESASPGFLVPITGESHLNLVDCLDVTVATAHLTPQDVVDLRLDNNITADQMQRAASFWLEEAGVPGTCNAIISFEGLKWLITHHQANIPVDETFAETLSQGLSVTRQILTPLPFGYVYLPNESGRVFRVKLDIQVNENTMGAGIKEVAPLNWDIRPIDNGGAIFKRSTREWIFTETLQAGFDRQIVYEVVLPDTETPSHVTLWGKSQGFIPRFETSTPGDSQVWLVECLDVPLAVAHMDTVNSDIDVTFSNLIQFDQIQTALAFWLEDVPVPGTCGKTIDFDTIKLLIAHWLTDTPVDQPLPGGTRFPEPAR